MDIEIRGYQPGDIGWVTWMHGVYYSEYWSLGPRFEMEVASELVAFIRAFDPARDGFWVAARQGCTLGAIAIDGRLSQGARLRWFIVAPECAGHGIGRQLMQTAMDFCRRAGHRDVFLWTMKGLDAARRIYEQHGFSLIGERIDEEWGTHVVHQHFAAKLELPGG
jgi:GNAT superfamily N-acetyltransferase